MLEPRFIIQVITFVTTVLFFEYLERSRPGFSIKRNHELLLNITAIVLTVFAGEYAKETISYGFESVHLSAVVSFAWLTLLPGAVKISIAIVLTDFSLYWVHWAMHRKILRRTHSFHHSIGVMWWLAGARTSIAHLFLFAIPQIFIGFYLLKLTLFQAGITVSFGIVVNLWIHTNLWVDLKPLDWLIITPNYHRIHHGAKGYSGKNLGFVFTIWDRMFGTFKDTQSTGKDFPLYAVATKNRLVRMLIGL
jgi:sterol desaturase/sphingolipid hydroxylase (fatty acid hydroxylase superfamily)